MHEEAHMAFQVYDYRTDIRNVLVTPQIRARLMRIEVGEVSGGSQAGRGHSHDLGYEVFLVLQGQAEFEIDGELRVLAPGQMCVAGVDQRHTVRNVGVEPVILYLSVTPHIQPTHTGWTDEGEKEPPRFNPSSVYDVPPDRSTPTAALLERHLAAIEALTEEAQAARDVQRAQAEVFRQALVGGQHQATLQARDAMWAALYPLFRQVYDLAEAWNDLTYRTADAE
jgi:quercetin dioxygenase-like cupin family protein